MNLGPAEIGLIVLAVMLLFGYKKLPDASRSLGRSLRIFKGEMEGLREGASDVEPDEPSAGRGAASEEVQTRFSGAAAHASGPPPTALGDHGVGTTRHARKRGQGAMIAAFRPGGRGRAPVRPAARRA
jgi:sec-independent protein translocase protein TatA